MNNKVISVVLVLVVVAIVFLAYQQIQLQKKFDKLLANQQDVKITPAETHTSPSETSPFDQSSVDPMAQQFPPNSTSLPLTQMRFDKMVHDFGRINEGEKVNTVFKFKNTGNKPLVISSAVGSCGCTVPNWPKTAIEPGQSGEIAVEFDSNHKSGEQSKTVTVKANTTPPTVELTIKSTVIPKDK